MRKFINKIYKEIVERDKLEQALVLVSFLVTFLIVRAITHLQKAGIIPNQTGGLHIHHMVPGIILVLISGYIGISYGLNQKVRQITAVFFGIGAALTIDEFALWLFLKDVYWAKQGRDSVDAVIIVIVLLVLGVLVAQVHGPKKK